jgi:EAL domain-containing protein (putative c-di-GMP-specific phosphodiesterase class I)/GGDEF domain-containing protein
VDATAESVCPAFSYETLLDQLAAGLAASQGTQALLLVDLDYPLGLQAQLGFRASAALIDGLADSFGPALGARGTVMRFGDSGCCALVAGIRNNGHAILAAERLRRAAEDTMTAAGMSVRPGLRVGIALFPRDAGEPETLLRRAQLASAAAQKRGVRALVYDMGCSDEVLQASQLGVAFAEALETGGLSVYYQPKVRIRDARVHGVEALLRWLQDGRPVASPDVFMPLAEQAGLIHDATWYVLSNSLRMSAAMGGLRVAVNVTPGMLHHREFHEMIDTALRSWHVPRGALTVELTEGALIADAEEAMARLMRVRDLGVRVSIDDFGTGYSSLSYFKNIPADEIKIDKSFVLRMLTNDDDRRLVQAIVALARQFRLEVVAEGVEDQQTLAELGALGVDIAQGFLFSPALDREQLQQWLDRRAAGAASVGSA